MKKVILTLTTITVLFFATPITGFAKEKGVDKEVTSRNIEQTDIEKEWDELQRLITESLTTENGYYLPNTEVISELVSNFNIDSFNEFYNLNYTTQSLYNQIIGNIEKTPVSTATYASYCGYNGTDYGWNYNRYLNDKNNTATWGTQLDDQAFALTIAGKVVDFFPNPYGKAIKLGTNIGSIWASTLSAALSSNNSKGTCGTITDINLFTSIFTVWYQPNY